VEGGNKNKKKKSGKNEKKKKYTCQQIGEQGLCKKEKKFLHVCPKSCGTCL